MKVLYLSLFALAAAGCREAKTAEEPSTASRAGTNAVLALVLDSKENMGCMVGQKLVGNVLPELARGVSLSGGTGSEDSATVRELYVGFDPSSQIKNSGKLGFRFWVDGGDAKAIVRNPKVEMSSGSWKLTFSASGNGRLQARPMWLIGDELEPVWRTCPEADIREAIQGTFLAGGDLEVPGSPPEGFELGADSKDYEVRFDREAIPQIERAARSFAILASLANKLGGAEGRWIWREDLVTKEAVMAAAVEPDSKGKPEIYIRFDDGRTIEAPRADFPPLAKFRLSILSTSGKHLGAEVGISASE